MESSIKGTKETDKFVLFYGYVSPFSNFYKGIDTQFEYKNHLFICGEQAYVWEKALSAGDTELANKILNLPPDTEPSFIKHLGYKIANFNQEIWDKNKFNIMVEIVTAKFSVPKMKYKLKKTENKIIAEASKDTIWGIGYFMNQKEATNPENWKGQNLLGNAIMEARIKLFK